jgi:hypothetical protein
VLFLVDKRKEKAHPSLATRGYKLPEGTLGKLDSKINWHRAGILNN